MDWLNSKNKKKIVMFFLQIPDLETGTAAMYVAAITALSGVIVTLALYIRKLHNKHTETLLKNSQDIIKVTTEVTNSINNNTTATKELSENLNDLHRTFLTTNR